MNLASYKKCVCEDRQCSKCLLINCVDPRCEIHSISKKKEFRLKYSVGRTGNIKN